MSIHHRFQILFLKGEDGLGEVLGELLAVGAAELAAEFELEGVDAVVFVAAVGADGEAAVVAAVFGRFAGRGVVRDHVVAHLRELAENAVGAGEGGFALLLDKAQDGDAIAGAAKDGGGIAGLTVEIDHQSLTAEALADLGHVIAHLIVISVVIGFCAGALEGVGGGAVDVEVFAVELGGDEVGFLTFGELGEFFTDEEGEFVGAVIAEDCAVGAGEDIFQNIGAAVRGGEEDGEVALLEMDEVGGGSAVRGLGEEAVQGEQEQGQSGGERLDTHGGFVA